MPARNLVTAVRGDEDELPLRRSACKHRENVGQGRLVRPLDVVEEDDGRLAVGYDLERPTERFEQKVSNRQFRGTPELRQERGKLPVEWAASSQSVRFDAEKRAKRLDERAIRSGRARKRFAGHRSEVGCAEGFLHQPCLAYAGLSGHEHETAVPSCTSDKE